MAYSMALGGVGGRRNLPHSPSIQTQALVPRGQLHTFADWEQLYQKPMYIRVAPAADRRLHDASYYFCFAEGSPTSSGLRRIHRVTSGGGSWRSS